VKRILILGAAGRDFHNFLVVYRDDPETRVVGFTAQQIPHIAERRFPRELAGPRYPHGIPIHPEESLEELIGEQEIDTCVLSYSDLSHEDVMHLASRVGAAGAGFLVLGARQTWLESSLPVIAVVASRTGAGKSQTSRAVVRILADRGLRVAVLRHPMPYGDLVAQRVQQFRVFQDLERHRVTLEEREEYEPHLAAGSTVWAGVDYREILTAAEAEADVILWDGGNNDTSFIRADLTLLVLDPHRCGHELRYHPGETNLRLADVVIVNKVDTARQEDVVRLMENVRRVRPEARILEAASPALPDEPERLRGRRVLAVEDGPTLTHGGMREGAAVIAARKCGARELVDPRPFAEGEIAQTFVKYPHIGNALPAMGYSAGQIRELEATIARACRDGGVEAVAVGTPVDLGGILTLPVPHTRVRYELQVLGKPTLAEVLGDFS
jgi:predicted GTPase